MSGGNAARRAIARWALRMFRRDWRQQFAVLILLTITVGAAVAGSSIAVNAASTAKRLGNASARLRVDDTDPVAAANTLEQIHAAADPAEVVAHSSITPPGSTTPLDVRDQSPADPLGAPLLRLRGGAFPIAPDQAALTKGAEEALGVQIGSTVDLSSRTVTVVGTVENPRDLGDQFLLVQPGSIDQGDYFTVLTNSFGDRMEPGRFPAIIDVETSNRVDEHRAIEAAVILAATLAMILAGLSAAAGFVVVAQRRQRQLGLLSAIGATVRHVRLVMIVNGAIVGVVASLLGSALGILGWVLAAPAVESAAGHRISRFDLPWGLITVLAILAVIMATGAAWWPARTATKLPVIAALSGRPSPPTPIHRSLLVAIVLATGGALAIGNSHPGTEQVSIPKVIGGMLALAAGIIFFTPTAIRAVGGVARRLPFAPRLALRDLARYQSRAAAALAAIVLSLSIAVAIVVVASANTPRASSGNLSSSELLIQLGAAKTFPTHGMTAAQIADLDARAATVAAALGTGIVATPLDVVFGNGSQPVSVAIQQGPHRLEFDGFPFAATPAVLALYGVEATSIDPSTDVLAGRQQDVLLVEGDGDIPKLGTRTTPLQHVALPRWSSAPHSLITSSALERHGWTTARDSWIVELHHPISHAQITAARAAAAAAGLAIQVRGVDDSMSSLRDGAVGVGSLLALSILTMAVGLIRGEARRDTRTLVATGAAARTRRAITASTAAGLAVPGVLLAIAGAYAGVIAVYHTKLHILSPVPFKHLLVLAVGLPIIAGAGGWLLAGRQPTTIARQALD